MLVLILCICSILTTNLCVLWVLIEVFNILVYTALNTHLVAVYLVPNMVGGVLFFLWIVTDLWEVIVFGTILKLGLPPLHSWVINFCNGLQVTEIILPIIYSKVPLVLLLRTKTFPSCDFYLSLIIVAAGFLGILNRTSYLSRFFIMRGAFLCLSLIYKIGILYFLLTVVIIWGFVSKIIPLFLVVGYPPSPIFFIKLYLIRFIRTSCLIAVLFGVALRYGWSARLLL